MAALACPCVRSGVEMSRLAAALLATLFLIGCASPPPAPTPSPTPVPTAPPKPAESSKPSATTPLAVVPTLGAELFPTPIPGQMVVFSASAVAEPLQEISTSFMLATRGTSVGFNFDNPNRLRAQ